MSRTKIPNIYIKDDDHYILKITSLKYGEFNFKLDEEDYDRCKEYHWSVNKYNRKSETGYFYAVNNKVGLLHRFIMNASRDFLVDHKDNNTLDNRKCNLRICNRSENNRNRKSMKNNKSGVIGVVWNDNLPTPKWMAYLQINKKFKNLGYYDKFEDAVAARLSGELEYFGEYRNTSKYKTQ